MSPAFLYAETGQGAAMDEDLESKELTIAEISARLAALSEQALLLCGPVEPAEYVD